MADIWPFAPSIRKDPYVVNREYRTDFIRSRSGREQRRGLRQTPRKRIEYTTSQCPEGISRFNVSMVTVQREQISIPDRSRSVTLENGLPAFASALVIDPVPTWIIPGAQLILRAGAIHSAREVMNVVGMTVSFTTFEATAYPAPTLIHPALFGYLDATISTNVHMGQQRRQGLDASVVFHVDPGSEDPPEDVGVADTTYAGRECFLTRPNRWMPVDIGRVQEAAAAADYGFGRVVRYFPVAFATRMWSGGYTGCSAEHADAIRQFFDRMKGQLHEFYMPTWENDLVPITNLTAVGTTVTVEGEGTLAAAYDDSTVWRNLAIKKTDGTWIMRRVTNVADITGGDAVITVASPWGVNVANSEIEAIMWMPLWRFSSDILTMSWPRDGVAEMTLAFQMLEDLAAE